MKSAIAKRSIVIFGHKTSVSLEDQFWNYLKEIAKSNDASLPKLIAEIESNRRSGNLSSAIRVFVLEHARVRMLSARDQIGADVGASRKVVR